MTNDSFKQAGTSIIWFSFFLCGTTLFWAFNFDTLCIDPAILLLILAGTIYQGSRPAAYGAIVFSLLYALGYLPYIIRPLITLGPIYYEKHEAQPGSAAYFALLGYYLAIVIWSSLNCYQLYKAIKSPLERSI